MSTRTCRDCGNVLAQSARGCPTCACNLEAEGMIDRFIWRRVAPIVVVVVFAVLALAYLWR
jgi:hypothetical protein